MNAAVNSTDLSDTKALTEDQINSMVGDASSVLAKEVERPANWPTEGLGFDDLMEQWANREIAPK